MTLAQRRLLIDLAIYVFFGWVFNAVILGADPETTLKSILLMIIICVLLDWNKLVRYHRENGGA